MYSECADIHCLENISMNTKPYAKRLYPVHERPRWIDEKTESRSFKKSVKIDYSRVN
jgi:hypothetical protein